MPSCPRVSVSRRFGRPEGERARREDDSGSFTIAQFEGWVDDCAHFASERHIAHPCIVILHNRALPNSPQFLHERNAFHSVTHSGTPYCYCLVFGENLSVADDNHTITAIQGKRSTPTSSATRSRRWSSTRS
jgi:hypothetical protein